MRNYLSGGHDETLKAAAEILKAGGNAFDAAVGAFAAAFVAEPAMSSPGAGGFALCSLPGKEPEALDFFVSTPFEKRPRSEIDLKPVTVKFGDEDEIYYCGAGSMGIPGAIRGIFEIHRRYGAMPMKEIFQYPIELAKNGIALNNFQHEDLSLLQSIFFKSERGREIFFDTSGELRRVGEVIRMEYLADFLDVLSREGDVFFYEGEIAATLHEYSRLHGGMIDRESMANYDAIWSRPYSTKYSNHTVYTMSNPSIGGALMLKQVDILQHISKSIEFRSQKYFDEMSGILKLGMRQANDADELMREFSSDYSTSDNRRGATSHFNILDKNGNGIALTMTLGEGSGYFIPGTDIHMNNMLGEPGLQPEGLHSWKPKSRMRSLMAPTCILDKDNLVECLLGTGGSVRIPFMLSQVYDNIYRYGMPLSEAIERPRIYFDGEVLQIEDSSSRSLSFSSEVNHWTRMSLFFGGVHGILKRSQNMDEYDVYGDFRRQGAAMSFG